MESTGVIETGVDKLVELVKKHGRVSFQDAAKELGVSKDVVTEWADFLSDENILGTEYKLTQQFLVDKKISKGEIEKKAREFTDKKDIFVRKAEGTVSVLQKEADNLNKLKGEFDRMKDEMGIELDSVKKELAELERFEQMKEELSKKILDEQSESKKRSEEMGAVIVREQKKFAELIGAIEREEQQLKRERTEANALEEKEKTLMGQMASVKSMIKDVEEKLRQEDSSIKHSEESIGGLQKLAKDIESHLRNEKEVIEPLIRKKEEHEKDIKALQEKILSGILKKKTPNKEKASDKLHDLFGEKLKVSTLIEKLNADRNSLEKELSELVKKAKAFQLTAKGKDLEKEIKDLEDKFKSVEQKKGVFEEEFKKLGKLLHLR
jgi:chromosome segregation ATPase